MKGLLVLTRTLGDVVLGNVLVKNIKLKYPELQLDYVVEDNYSDLVLDNPNISKVIQVKNTLDEWDNILNLIISEEYDKVFVPQQTTVTDNRWHQTKKYGLKHLLNFYAGRCNIKVTDSKLELFVNGELQKEKYTSPIVAIHTRTLADVKNWSKFTELAKVLKEQNYMVVQLGHKDDEPIENAIKLDLSLKEIMQFFKEKRCDMFVGLDSGLSYVATAFNIPVIALYGPTIPETSGVYGDTVDIILADNNEKCKEERSKIRCHGILGGKCGYGSKCIDKITVEQVVDKIKEKLERSK